MRLIPWMFQAPHSDHYTHLCVVHVSQVAFKPENNQGEEEGRRKRSSLSNRRLCHINAQGNLKMQKKKTNMMINEWEDSVMSTLESMSTSITQSAPQPTNMPPWTMNFNTHIHSIASLVLSLFFFFLSLYPVSALSVSCMICVLK